MTVLDDAILRVTQRFYMDSGDVGCNVYHYVASFGSAYDDIDVFNPLLAQMDQVYTMLVDYVPGNTAMGICTVDELAWDPVENEWGVARLVGQGTPTVTFVNASDPLPNQSSAVITFPTGIAGRRGRKFLPPFGEDQQTAGYMDVGLVADLLEVGEEMAAVVVVLAADVLIPIILAAAEDTFTLIEGWVVSDILGSQRRRKPVD